ncbi:MAG TPA: hypothetical protein VK403_10195 [Allosphingosinicella sp.]|nr:hypothetical protein [Allosphingosinicella sp.]
MKRASLSFRLARALEKGRAPGAFASREAILAALLSKRAAARRAGLKDQEAMLRGQILWSLPVRHPADGEEEAAAIPNP